MYKRIVHPVCSEICMYSTLAWKMNDIKYIMYYYYYYYYYLAGCTMFPHLPAPV